jgi:DNA-directed RNA polymerase specialized sigma24 family protein
VHGDDPDLTAALDAARRGDENGFRTLYRAVQPGLLRYLRVLAPDDADDVASETWLQVSRDLNRFSGGGRRPARTSICSPNWPGRMTPSTTPPPRSAPSPHWR